MVVLSLFNGMSCGYMALQEAGIPIDKYYSSEIDKYANKMSDYLFLDIVQIGDVRDIDVSKLEPIDILIGGSPCQSFSFAGKRKGMSTKDSVEIYTLEHYLELKDQGFEFEGQSYLFWEYMRILNDIRKYNPNVLFLLENVEMGEKWEMVLSKAIGIKGVHINSALVSAQSRKRIYWTNINKKTFGLWGYEYADIPQPKDRCILLKDILESDVAEKYYLSDKVIKNMLKWEQRNIASGNGFKNEIKDENEKSCAIPTGSMKSSSTYVKIDRQGNPKPNQDKASCFTAGAHSGGNHSDMDLICVAMRGRNPDNPSDRTTGTETEQRLEPKTDGITNCLTSVQKDNYISECSKIRRLTERECARLQTVPEELIDKMLSSGVSSTQVYKMLGNGWTIDVIKHIFSFIKF